jgi:putative glutamine amidotransferase
MAPRIAIPIPHSGDSSYTDRALPQYEHAVEMAGGEPVRIPLDQSSEQVMKLIEGCDAVLLPGSKADVDPAKYAAPKHPQTADADLKRDAIDELLLRDAYVMRKPVLGICYGLQSLNVHRAGTLMQHIKSRVNHAAGRTVPVAHTVEVDPESKLANIVASGANALLSPASPVFSSAPARPAFSSTPGSTVEGHGFSRANKSAAGSGALAPEETELVLPVNSSHHQAAASVGDGLRVVARSPQDGIIEALEGTSPDHFVLAVQWHPERSVDNDEPSRAIFRALVEAARARHGS